MSRILLNDVSLSFPLLGRGMRQVVSPEEKRHSAGSVIVGKNSRSMSVAALSNISLDLRDGDRLGIIGRNGSGKSTLLKVLAGIYEPQIGSVLVEGRVASLLSVGLGMQLDATGYRNIELMGLVSGLTRNDIRERAPAIAKFSQLGPYLSMPVTTYSNGMKMRLRFAASTAFDPDVLLIDEWLGAGDAEFRKQSGDRMNELMSKTGILVLATHKNKAIKELCNKCLWLDKGVPKMVGDAGEVLHAYENRDI